MAYRQLVVGDKVKVKPLDVMHPQLQYSNEFGEVIEVSSLGAEVSFSSDFTEHRVWFKQSELMVAADDLSGSIYRFQYSHSEQNELDDEDKCEYADWDRDDLIYKIKSLTNQVDSLNDQIEQLEAERW